MPDLLIRGLPRETIERLKARARRHGRSLQSELRLLVERCAGLGAEEVAAVLQRWQRRFAGRKFSSGARWVREDRRR